MAILVLGLGNTIMSDDGFGVRVVETLSSRCRFHGDVSLLDGNLAWRQHDGGHTDAPNWKYFIAWAAAR